MVTNTFSNFLTLSLNNVPPNGYDESVYPPDLLIISKTLSDDEIEYFPGCLTSPVIEIVPICSLSA